MWYRSRVFSWKSHATFVCLFVFGDLYLVLVSWGGVHSYHHHTKHYHNKPLLSTLQFLFPVDVTLDPGRNNTVCTA